MNKFLLTLIILFTVSMCYGTTELAPHDLTSNTSHPPYVASASTEFAGVLKAYRAFEGSAGTYWLADNGGSGWVDQWLKLDLGAGVSATLSSYQVQVNAVPEPTRAPQDWQIQGSNDDSAWTTVDTQTAQTAWGSSEIRTYTLGSVSSAYRYYRVLITANNGDPQYTQIAELYLIGTFVSTGSGGSNKSRII